MGGERTQHLYHPKSILIVDAIRLVCNPCEPRGTSIAKNVFAVYFSFHFALTDARLFPQFQNLDLLSDRRHSLIY